MDETIGGRFRVEREIAKGGMGRVVLAHDTRGGPPVAVKHVLPHLLGTDAERRFERECRAARLVRSSHVPHALAIGTDDRVGRFLAMEYIAGETLHDWVRTHGALGQASLVRIARDLLQALRDIRRAGVVHRDVKPANVLLPTAFEGTSSVERARLIDFGICRFLGEANVGLAEGESITTPGRPVGTLRMMAPEQLTGAGSAEARTATDVYGWGMVMFVAGSGRRPFADAESAKELVAAVLEGGHPGPHRAHTDCDPRLGRLVERALNVNPALRPNLAEIGEELERLCEDSVFSPGTSRGRRRAARRGARISTRVSPVVPPARSRSGVSHRAACSAPSAQFAGAPADPTQPSAAPIMTGAAIALPAPPKRARASSIPPPPPKLARSSAPPPPAKLARSSAPPPPAKLARSSAPPPSAKLARSSAPPPPPKLARSSAPPPPPKLARPSVPPPPPNLARPSVPPPPPKLSPRVPPPPARTALPSRRAAERTPSAPPPPPTRAAIRQRGSRKPTLRGAGRAVPPPPPPPPAHLTRRAPVPTPALLGSFSHHQTQHPPPQRQIAFPKVVPGEARAPSRAAIGPETQALAMATVGPPWSRDRFLATAAVGFVGVMTIALSLCALALG